MAKKSQSREILTLFLIDGSEVEITYPSNWDDFDEWWYEFKADIELGRLSWVGNYDDVGCIWQGRPLEYLNCRLVVGMR